MKEELTAKDFILLLLNSNDRKPIKGKLIFQKEMFLIVEEIYSKIKEELNFIPYTYGPYSKNLVKLVNELKQDSLIKYNNIDRDEYSITERGIDYISKINFPDFIVEKVNNLKIGSDRLGYDGVLRYVYFHYPEYTINSKIKKYVLGD